MPDAIKYTTKLVMTPAKGYRLVERDMIVVREDGSMRIVRAGTTLPLYDEAIVITQTDE